MEVKVFVTPGFGGGWSAQPYTAVPPAPVTATAAAARTSREMASAAAEGTYRPGVPGRSEFLHLLTTQLKYQDPLQPIQDHEFIAQLAQFSTLEELQGLNRRMDELARLQLWVSGMGQAATLIGREVTVELPDGTSVTGTVSSVRMEGGVPYVQVGDREYPVTSVSRVR